MKEKELLSAEEIKSPTLLELSDDELESVEGGNCCGSTIVTTLSQFIFSIFNLGGGGGGGGGGAGGSSSS